MNRIESKQMLNIDLPLRDIEYPGDNDVKCGRGAGTTHHQGNIQHRKMVEARVLEYVNSPSATKGAIVTGIIQEVRAQNPPGRFLKKNCETGNWDAVDDQRIRKKTSQLFRDTAATIFAPYPPPIVWPAPQVPPFAITVPICNDRIYNCSILVLGDRENSLGLRPLSETNVIQPADMRVFDNMGQGELLEQMLPLGTDGARPSLVEEPPLVSYDELPLGSYSELGCMTGSSIETTESIGPPQPPPYQQPLSPSHNPTYSPSSNAVDIAGILSGGGGALPPPQPRDTSLSRGAQLQHDRGGGTGAGTAPTLKPPSVKRNTSNNNENHDTKTKVKKQATQPIHERSLNNNNNKKNKKTDDDRKAPSSSTSLIPMEDKPATLTQEDRISTSECMRMWAKDLMDNINFDYIDLPNNNNNNTYDDRKPPPLSTS